MYEKVYAKITSGRHIQMNFENCICVGKEERKFYEESCKDIIDNGSGCMFSWRMRQKEYGAGDGYPCGRTTVYGKTMAFGRTTVLGRIMAFGRTAVFGRGTDIEAFKEQFDRTGNITLQVLMNPS